MSGTRTNSNSITSILIEKLNNKKSGFRQEMLRVWELPIDTLFCDGTHTPSKIEGLEKKEPDIIGYSIDKPKVLMEIKASINEPLQGSQKKNGEYEKAAKANCIKLIFIIPDSYIHKEEITKDAEILCWSKIYSYANEFDNTGLTKQIESFVENDFDELDNIFSKEDAITFLDSKSINETLEQYKILKDEMDSFKDTTGETIQKNNDDFGFEFTYEKGTKKIRLWVGMCYLKERPKDFLYIYTNDDWLNENKEEQYLLNRKKINNNSLYIDGYAGLHAYFFPIQNEKQSIEDLSDYKDGAFNKLLKQNLNKVFTCIERRK